MGQTQQTETQVSYTFVLQVCLCKNLIEKDIHLIFRIINLHCYKRWCGHYATVIISS